MTDQYKYTTLDDSSASGAGGTIAAGINDAGLITGYFADGSNAHPFLYNDGAFTTLADPAPNYGIPSDVAGINDAGQIVDGNFVYNSGSWIPLGDDPLAQSGTTIASGINNAGQIVGTYETSNGSGAAAFHGFVDNDGTFTTIDVNESYEGTFAEGINNEGQIVGWFQDGAGIHAFLDSGGTVTTLNDPSGSGTVATGINNAGQIVGYYYDQAGHTNGFVYTDGSFTTIDDPLGTFGTTITGINDSGQVVGFYNDGTGAHGFIAAPTLSNQPPVFSYTTLDDPSATYGTYAQGISDAGQIVGYYRVYSGAIGFIYDNGAFTTLQHSLSDEATYLWGVNDVGQIVGQDNDGSGHAHGFIYSDGTYISIDDPLNDFHTIAYGINDTGLVVGAYTDAGYWHGFTYSNGTYTSLDDPLATGSTYALGVNNAGQIVGNFENASGLHGFIYSDGIWTTLDDPSASGYTSAGSINNSGQIVGTYYDANDTLQSFLYSNGTYITVNDTQASGSTDAQGINDAGQIVGNYSDSSGTHGFVATPNETTNSIFFDDFNRPDGLPGNGWSELAASNSVISDGVLTPVGPGVDAGIYRPVNLTGPITFSADLTQENGDGPLERYTTTVLIGNNGDDTSGYGIAIYRGDANYADSAVALVYNGVQIDAEQSSFQFGPAISVNFTLATDGSIIGTVSGNGNAFNFNFDPRAVTFSGSNLTIVQSGSDARGSTIIQPTIDNVQIIQAATPTWAITANANPVSENAGSVVLNITRPSSTSAATVYVSTVQNQGYYNAATGTTSTSYYYGGLVDVPYTFAAGQNSLQVPITIYDHGLTSGSEKFGFEVQDAAGGNLAATTFTIANNDTTTTTYSVSPGHATVNENAGALTFAITRSDDSQQATVDISTAQDQGYYNAASGAESTNYYYDGLDDVSLTFAAGQSSIEVPITLHDNGLTFGSEKFSIDVQNTSGANLASTTFTILNSDPNPGEAGPGNSTPSIQGPAALAATTFSPVPNFTASITSSDSGGFVEFYVFTRTSGTGNLTLDGQDAGATVEVLASQLQRVGYLTGGTPTIDHIAVQAIDNNGAKSNPLDLSVNTSAPTGTSPSPNAAVLADLSSDVYRTLPAGADGYATVPYDTFGDKFDSLPDGFFGNVYASADGSQVVIAIEGTANIDNLFADGSWVPNVVNSELRGYFEDAVHLLLNVEDAHPGATIQITGHSLGGALALLSGEASNLQATGFDAPGAQEFYQTLLNDLKTDDEASYDRLTNEASQRSSRAKTNYRLYADPISTVGDAIGNTITLPNPSPNPSDLPPLDNHSVNWLDAEMHGYLNGLPADQPLPDGTDEPNQWGSIAAGASGLLESWLGLPANAFDPKWFDPPPGNSDFVYSQDQNSPPITSIELPILPGVQSYEIRYETGSSWSAYQQVWPEQWQAPGTGVNGVEFIPLDAAGHSLAVTDSVIFGLVFGLNGTINATLNSSVVDAASGGPGNDTFTADTTKPEDFFGNGGTDTVVFSGSMENYAIVSNKTHLTASNGGITDTLTGITKLDFADGIATYDAQGNLVAQTFDNTSGSSWVDTYDPENTSDLLWSTSSYDANGNLLSQTTTNDDGTHSLTLYDVNNSYNWSSATINFDSKWRQTSVSGTNDDGSHTTTPKGLASAYDTALWFATPFDPNWNSTTPVTLAGDSANDFLVGNAGNDMLVAGTGNDILYGNGGSNTFAFGPGSGQDKIMDFQTDQDMIQFNPALFANYAAVMQDTTQVGANTVIQHDANTSVTLENTLASNLTANNFHFS